MGRLGGCSVINTYKNHAGNSFAFQSQFTKSLYSEFIPNAKYKIRQSEDEQQCVK